VPVVVSDTHSTDLPARGEENKSEIAFNTLDERVAHASE